MSPSRKPNRARLTALVGAAAAAALMSIAPAAQAGSLVASAPNCAEEALSRPFLPWADPASYQFAPDGGFESGGEGWTLGGGSHAVSGNESYSLHAAGDSRSLAIPASSSATSPTVCVGIEHPTIRFLARKQSGGPLSRVSVEVLFEDAAGDVHSAPIGVAGGSAGWTPTPVMPIVANLLPLLPGDHTPVAFRFTAEAGDWRVDDLYVDPYRRS